MPSLSMLLEETMLMTAARHQQMALVPLEADETIVPDKPKTFDGDDEATVLAAPIWSWRHDPSKPELLTNVTVRSRAMNFHAVTVAEKIEFTPVKVRFKQEGESIELPVNRDFVLRKYFLESGQIPESSQGLWRLETNVDVSLMIVLGYYLDEVSGEVLPLPDWVQETLEHEDFFPEPQEKLTQCRVYGGEGAIHAHLGVPMFIVAASVTCCKERPDWEPGGILGAARIFPHVMVISSVCTHHTEGAVELHRPAKTMKHSPDDEMEEDIGAIFIADQNDTKWIPEAAWGDLFSHHSLEPYSAFDPGVPLASRKPDTSMGHPKEMEAGETCFVDYALKQREIKGASEHLIYAHREDETWIPGLGGPGHLGPAEGLYEALTFTKEERQGEFDNVHLAPRMRVKLSDGTELRDIVMAPFCVHDCLHMHTRWGTGFLSTPMIGPTAALHGFDGREAPNAVPGAPLVPSDQRVFVSLPSSHAVRYRAVANRIPMLAGKWHCFVHHGFAQAVDIWPTIVTKGFAEGAKALPVTLAMKNAEKYAAELPLSWGMLYWRLRYGRLGKFAASSVVERLRFKDAKLARR